MIRGHLRTLNRLPEWEIHKSMSHPGILFICGLRVGFFRDERDERDERDNRDNRENRDSRDAEKLETTETQRRRDNRER